MLFFENLRSERQLMEVVADRLSKIGEIMKAYEAGEIDDPRPLNFAEIEGMDLNTVFEPIWRAPL